MKRYANSINSIREMRLICPLFIVLLVLAACSGNADRERLEKIVEKWQGKEIVLPDVMTDFLTGDTIDLSDADFTILSYVDSAGCTGCKMKLPLWKIFLDSINSVCDSDVQFLMVVHPSGIKDLKYYIKTADFKYPVYIDNSNQVLTANSFPEKTVLQAFLLDRNKKVATIGSPLYSEEMAMLYKSIILGQMSVSTETRNMVSISDNRIYLGNLHPRESRSREIIFTNHSNDTVCIKNIISSCDCTDLSIPKDYIPPRSNIKTVLQFAGDTVIGNFERNVHIYYSDFEYPTVITISGNIIN